MFERDHHVRIATVLQALDADILMARRCLFGGGTAIVLSHDEYRESIDIDFLISDTTGYRDLRHQITGKMGLQAIVRNGVELTLASEIRTDQYGIRTMLNVGGVELKFEIVFESRISLESPCPQDRICTVGTLTQLDMAASKLLANSDRWADDAVCSRDLIDLAMLNLSSQQKNQAIKKASAAYGESVKRDLQKSIETLKARKGRLNECMTALKMDSFPEALLWQKIRALLKGI